MTDEQLNNIIILIGAMIQENESRPENGKPPSSEHLDTLNIVSDTIKALRESV